MALHRGALLLLALALLHGASALKLFGHDFRGGASDQPCTGAQVSLRPSAATAHLRRRACDRALAAACLTTARARRGPAT